jgi:hypothetical protein
MTAERLDQAVDEGNEDVLQHFDLENARRGGGEIKRINIDLPAEFLADLDREAVRRGITRGSLIKVWLYDRLYDSGISSKAGISEQMVSAFGSIYGSQDKTFKETKRRKNLHQLLAEMGFFKETGITRSRITRAGASTVMRQKRHVAKAVTPTLK